MYAKLTGQTNTSTDEFESPVLAGLNVPPPVFFCSIEAPSVSKQRDMEQALNKIQREDPSLKVIFCCCKLSLTHHDHGNMVIFWDIVGSVVSLLVGKLNIKVAWLIFCTK
ncbi:hypothetical protein DPMN_096947 [Dreissena polymorpha]|uniref:Elongation Factor G domain-containing protein n=1 Tax=Dreissena polymorpha TaxID=45954 RepID=A0A9D4L9D5_DREPO|nr:hypothetical protein DPMN_096947 [Dreissena polymorpha]